MSSHEPFEFGCSSNPSNQIRFSGPLIPKQDIGFGSTGKPLFSQGSSPCAFFKASFPNFEAPKPTPKPPTLFPSPFTDNNDNPNHFFTRPPNLFNVDPKPIGFGCGVVIPNLDHPSLFSIPTTPSITSPGFYFPPQSLKCFSNIPSPSPSNPNFGPPQLSDTAMVHVCQKCGHKTGQRGGGSQGMPYPPRTIVENRLPEDIHSISAMPFYQHKSHEELRWEDYQSQVTLAMDFSMSCAAKLMLDGIRKDSSNVVFSPMSITLALNMLASGSHGETLDQFLEVQGYKDVEEINYKSQAIMSLLGEVTVENDGSSQPSKRRKKRHLGRGPVFAMANAIWIDRRWSLKPSFQDITSSIYKAHVKNVDLVLKVDKVVKDVNSWAEKKTRGLIKEILKPGTQLNPPLCLANALYFKGTWQTQFETRNTRDEDFHLLNGTTIKAPFLSLYDKTESYGSFKDFRLLKMRYEQGGYSDNKKFSMCIFLPRVNNGLKDLVEKLNKSDSKKTLYSKCFGLERQKLSKVQIPKMKFSHAVDAKKILEKNGLKLPFHDKYADFTSMVNDVDRVNFNVYVGTISHKAFIEVNEKGTEAAAITLVRSRLGCSAMPQTPPPSFVADHPFMFMIVEDTSKLIVFTGVVLNPLLS